MCHFLVVVCRVKYKRGTKWVSPGTMVTFLPVLIGFCDRNVATHNYAGTNGNESGAA